MKRAISLSALTAMVLASWSGAALAADHKDFPRSPTEIKARGYLEKKDYKNAITQYNLVMTTQPNNARALARRGLSEAHLRDYGPARKDFDRAWALGARGSDILELAFMLFHFYRETLQDEDAMVMLELTHKADPDDHGYYFTKAEIMQGESQLKEALANINKFVSLEPNNAEGWCRKGDIEGQLNDDRAALVSYGKSIARSPTFSVSLLREAHCWERLGNWPKAIADYTTAIKLTDDNHDGYTHKFSAVLDRGTAYAKVGDMPKALKDFDSILTAAEKDKSNFREGAARYATKAGQLKAKLLVSQKRFEEACATYTELISFADDWGTRAGILFQERANIYRLMGKNNLADADEAQAAKAASRFADQVKSRNLSH